MSAPRPPKAVDANEVLEACGAYVDDAACFPEQFKPGVVKRHQRQYAQARAAIEAVLQAADRLQDKLPKGMSLQSYFAGEDLVALRQALTAAKAIAP